MTSTTAHHRHPHKEEEEEEDDVEQSGQISEASPLQPRSFKQHLSLLMDEEDDAHPSYYKTLLLHPKRLIVTLLGLFFCLATLRLLYLAAHSTSSRSTFMRSRGAIPVDRAQEYWLPVDSVSISSEYRASPTNQTIQLWYRTWGRRDGGIPIVFVHGGPGNAIADYFGNSNQRFFDYTRFFVVEIDQRGTGNSQPSVRDGWKNMKYYQDISIDQMCHDFEIVRKHLGIDQWLVWGGSFGSTLAINYGERYPESSLALILRGIYLDTEEEVSTIYARKSYEHNPKRLREFNILYDYAAQYVEDVLPKDDPLDPNDAERIMRVYADMITQGDRHAIWHWFVFENNLMELNPQLLLDPNHINEKRYHEALSVSFFETRLWIHGSYEAPVTNLLDRRKLERLTMPLWVCQGQHDEVCPPQYGRRFVDAVEAAGQSPRVVSRFLNATHEDTDPALAECLLRSLQEFVDVHQLT